MPPSNPAAEKASGMIGIGIESDTVQPSQMPGPPNRPTNQLLMPTI